MSSHQNAAPLEIVREDVLVAIPRGDEELRVTYTEAKTADGKAVAWHSIRVFWKAEDGTWKPGKSGVTVRAKELRSVVAALIIAVAGTLPEDAKTAARLVFQTLKGGTR